MHKDSCFQCQPFYAEELRELSKNSPVCSLFPCDAKLHNILTQLSNDSTILSSHDICEILNIVPILSPFIHSFPNELKDVIKYIIELSEAPFTAAIH